ncbi:MAG: MarR family transcriptional regulator [Pseudomonadota bacterium]
MDLSDNQIATILARSADSNQISDDDRDNIRTFSEQLIAIAQLLRKDDLGGISEMLRTGAMSHPSSPSPSPSHSLEPSKSDPTASTDNSRSAFVDLARNAYFLRRRRTGIFGTVDIFGEPGWDILLDLYIAHSEDKPVSVSSACIGSASPPTTGLRWLGVLADHDLIVREHDPDDQRRILVKLTDHALQCLDTYFASAAKTAGSA